MENKIYPELRFNEFENNWDISTMGELATIVRGASPRPIQDPRWFDQESEIGWLRISDVTSQNGRIKFLQQKISEQGQEKTRVLTTPHLLLSIAATVGKPVINYVKTGVHDGFLIFQNPSFDQEFMFQWLEMFRSKWQKYGQPGSQVNLNSEIVQQQEIFLPELEEQKKIGLFFKYIDENIALYQQELDTLKQTKQGFLQKMFPKEGETVPEVRFDGFDTEWVRYKFNDLIKLTGGATPFKDNKSYWNGDIVWLSSQEIKNKYVSEGTYKITKQAVKDNRTKIVPTGTPLIVTRSGILAKRFPLSISNNEVAINQDIKALIYDQKKIDTEFLVAEISSKESYILSNIVKAGTTVQSVNIPDLEKMNLSLPCFKEQIKIGQFFKKLDKTIELHEKELLALKETKKAFLQKMFV